MDPSSEPLVVRSLVCHQHVGMGIKCLSSLFRCSDRPIDLRLHDDGSLTPEDRSLLHAAFPDAHFIARDAADQLVAEKLQGMPGSLEFRELFISALKIFDMLLLAREPFLLLDTDVLFFNPFDHLVDEFSREKALIYMEDCKYSYTLTPWEVAAYPELKPVYRLNSGMMFVRGDRIDLAFLEYLLHKHPQFRRNWQVEQTIWGILAHKYGSRQWDKRQVAMVTDDFQPSLDQVAAHFVTTGRHRLNEFVDLPPSGISGRRVRLRSQEPAVYGTLQLARDHLGNTIHNTLYRLRTSFHPDPHPA